MLLTAYYSQNYASIMCQGLASMPMFYIDLTVELKLYAAITLLVSPFLLLAPSMHWRCTEGKVKCTSCVYTSTDRLLKLHACNDIVQERVVVLTLKL